MLDKFADSPHSTLAFARVSEKVDQDMKEDTIDL